MIVLLCNFSVLLLLPKDHLPLSSLEKASPPTQPDLFPDPDRTHAPANQPIHHLPTYPPIYQKPQVKRKTARTHVMHAWVARPSPRPHPKKPVPPLTGHTSPLTLLQTQISGRPITHIQPTYPPTNHLASLSHLIRIRYRSLKKHTRDIAHTHPDIYTHTTQRGLKRRDTVYTGVGLFVRS